MGILKRAVVVDVGESLIELVNPEIVSAEGEQSGPEGCLSVPGRSGIVVRPERVTVRAQNAHGEPIEVTGEGFLARAFCHEIDHLDGILYVDKMVREIFPDEEEADGEAETGWGGGRRVKVVFMGTPDFSVPTLQALVDAGYEVAGAFTQPDPAKGARRQGAR